MLHVSETGSHDCAMARLLARACASVSPLTTHYEPGTENTQQAHSKQRFLKVNGLELHRFSARCGGTGFGRRRLSPSHSKPPVSVCALAKWRNTCGFGSDSSAAGLGSGF